jgi:hypothetical protein
MSASNGIATIGLQVILQDAASAGLTAFGIGFLGLSSSVYPLSKLMGGSFSPALMGFGLLTVASAALLGIFAGATG